MSELVDGHALADALSAAAEAHEADPTDETKAAHDAAQVAVAEARRAAREARNAAGPHEGLPIDENGKLIPVIFDRDEAARHNTENESPFYGDAATGVASADLAASKAAADATSAARLARRGADVVGPTPATVTGSVK